MRALARAVGFLLLLATPAFAADVKGVLSAQSVDTTVAATALGSLNAACTIAMAGQQGAGFQLAAGTLIGTITPEVSLDGGTTYVTTFFDDPVTGNKSSTVIFGSANTVTTRTIVVAGGASHARVRVSAFTSGTANCTLKATTSADPALLMTGAAASAAPPVVDQVGGSDGTLLRAIAVDSSGNQKVIGPAANNAAQSGNPVQGGAVAVAKGSAPATVTAGNVAALTSDTERRLLVNNVHPNIVSGNASAVTTTTQILGLSGANLSYYITDIVFYNNVSTTQTFNVISSTTAGNACATAPATVTPNIVMGAVANGTFIWPIQTPIKVAANSAVCCKVSAATSATCILNGFIGP